MTSPKSTEQEIPDDLREALEATPDAYAAFLVMPPSHRREYLSFIDEAKSTTTRARRILRAMEMMSQWKAERVGERKQSRKVTSRDKPGLKGAVDTARRKSGKRG
ncbi:MAG: YdeI/OmpD-associated family protein [Deltaproteobacteria bacterium]|nr:YdeI/OmpD-associated family protein [Deltaproteobacteria bacterium]